MTTHYDLQGKPLTLFEWIDLTMRMGNRPVHVGDDKRRAMGHRFRVSTIWLGIDYSFGQGPPLIFETMVFDHTPRGATIRRLPFPIAESMFRYATMEDALEGHAAMLRIMHKLDRWRHKPAKLIHKGRKP